MLYYETKYGANSSQVSIWYGDLLKSIRNGLCARVGLDISSARRCGGDSIAVAIRPLEILCHKESGKSLTFGKTIVPVVQNVNGFDVTPPASAMDADRKQRFTTLVKAVAEDRDRTAFTELFDFYAPRLKSFLMRQRMGAGEAEDLAQEVMVVLWHKSHLYDPAKSSLSTWLFRIARNRSIDAARRKRRAQFDQSDPLLQPAGDPLPDEGLEMDDRERIVRVALSNLPADQIDLVRKAFFYGQSHTEIAAETGLPLGTVKSRIRLAFGKLRKLLDDAGIRGA